jgi:ATP-dependent DNA ligase
MVVGGSNLIVSKFIYENGIKFFQACVSKGLEGVVGKKIDSVYLPGRRSSYWKKICGAREADLLICGFQYGKSGRGLGSLLLGGVREGKIIYQGRVGSGFDDREADALLEALHKIKVAEEKVIVPKEEKKKTSWVEPFLVCRVEYLNITSDGRLRHPVYRGIRWEKKPEECTAAD